MDYLKYIKKIPIHITSIGIIDNTVDHEELMRVISDMVDGDMGYYLHISDFIITALTMRREGHIRLLVEFPLAGSIPQTMLNDLTDLVFSNRYNGPPIDLSGSNRIASLHIYGDITKLQGLKVDKVTYARIAPESLGAELIRNFKSLTWLTTQGLFDTNIEVDLSELPSEYLIGFNLEGVTVTGLPLNLSKLSDMHVFDATILSPLDAPNLKELHVHGSSSFAIGNMPVGINSLSVEKLSASDPNYESVGDIPNMRSLTLISTPNENIPLKSHPKLRKLKIINISRECFEPAIQPTLRILRIDRDYDHEWVDDFAAAIFGTDAIEYIDDIHSYVYALSE
jgi:hypothetical protein